MKVLCDDKYDISDKLWFRGFFYFDEKKYESCKADGTKIYNIVSDAVEKNKIKCFNGNFAIVIDIGGKKYAIVDRIMSFPLYYGYKDGELYISDRVKSLLKVYGEIVIDKKAVQEFYSAGFVLGDSTVYRNINIILAGCYMEIDNLDNTQVIRYFDHVHNAVRPGSFDGLAKELNKITDKVFQRMIEGFHGRQVVLFLSGGYDSRLVAVELKKFQYENVICFSFTSRIGREESVAKKIASELGYKLILINQVEEFKKIEKTKSYKDYLLQAGGGYTYPYIQGCMLKEYLDNGTIDKDCIVITGNSGDVIEGEDFSTELCGKETYSKDEVIDAIIKKHCIQKGLKYGRQRYFLDLIEKELPCKDSYSYEESQDIFERFNWLHRQAKYVVNDVRCYDIYLGVDWRLPLWDNDLVDFWLKVPVEYREFRKLYYKSIEEEKYDTANIKTWYDKMREWIRKNMSPVLYALYPFRKVYMYLRDRKWDYYGEITLKKYLRIVFASGGYKTNAFTVRLEEYCDEFIKPYIK